MTEELKPCPFCGGEARLHDENFILCDECCTEGNLYTDPSDAIAAWNRRATPPTDAMKGDG
jgi:Lar family restriction alleviation protein